jgi:hypothetical protein
MITNFRWFKGVSCCRGTMSLTKKPRQFNAGVLSRSCGHVLPYVVSQRRPRKIRVEAARQRQEDHLLLHEGDSVDVRKHVLSFIRNYSGRVFRVARTGRLRQANKERILTHRTTSKRTRAAEHGSPTWHATCLFYGVIDSSCFHSCPVTSKRTVLFQCHAFSQAPSSLSVWYLDLE